VGAVAAATVVFLRQDETPEPAIALDVPAQIAHPDPLRFEPGRAEEYERSSRDDQRAGGGAAGERHPRQLLGLG